MIKIDNKKINPHNVHQMYHKKVVFQYDDGLYFYKNDKTFEIITKGLYSVVENNVNGFYNRNLYYVSLHESTLTFNIYDLEKETNNVVHKLDLNILKEFDESYDIDFEYITDDYLLLKSPGDHIVLDLKNGQLLELSELNKPNIHYNIHSINVRAFKNDIKLIAHERNQTVDFDTLDFYNHFDTLGFYTDFEEIDEDFQVDIKYRAKITVIDFNKFISGKSNYTNIVFQDNKWCEETSIINFNLNLEKFYLLTKNCLHKTNKVSVFTLVNNSLTKNEKFNLKGTYFDMRIFEYKNKVYAGPKVLTIFKKPTDFNFKVEHILDNKICFNILLKNISNLWIYYLIGDDKLFLSYTDNKRPITNCIYNKLDNSIEYINGNIAPKSFGSKELVVIQN